MSLFNESITNSSNYTIIPISDVNLDMAEATLNSKISVLLKSVATIIGALVAIFGNMFSLFALIKYVSSLNQSTSLIMGGLLVSNIIAALGCLYNTNWTLKLYYFKIPACQMKTELILRAPVQQIPACIMYFMVCLLCVERYVAIVHPFKYKSWMSVKRVKILIGTSWIIISPVVFNYFFGNEKATCIAPYTDMQLLLPVLIAFIIVSMLITYTYSRIFYVALKQYKRISAMNVIQVVATVESKSSMGDQNSVSQKGRELKATKTVTVIVGFFYFSWLPLVLGKVLKVVIDQPNLFTTYFLEVGTILGFTCIFLTWLIYGITNKDFKEAYYKVLASIIYRGC